MSKPIRQVGVIGAGVMGSGIAAHFANAKIKVKLLDIVPPGLSEAEKKDKKARNKFSQGGLDKALAARPAAFFHKGLGRLVSTGNLEDDLESLADCDLVIEAIIERLDHKKALFERLEAVLSPDCIIASNTSGLRIADMVEGRSESFKKRFLVMHFFNPVRYMKLLELVSGADTAPEVTSRVARLGEEAPRPVRRLARLLVEREVCLGPGRHREGAERHAGRPRKRRAEKTTARLPARFADIPRMISTRPKRMPYVSQMTWPRRKRRYVRSDTSSLDLRFQMRTACGT